MKSLIIQATLATFALASIGQAGNNLLYTQPIASYFNSTKNNAYCKYPVLVSSNSGQDQNTFCGIAKGTPHTLTIVMTVDNQFNLNLAGHVIRGPFDAPTYNTLSWGNIQTYTRTVYGDGPFLIAVDGADFGVIAGMFAAVYLDGQLYTDTGVTGSQWKLTNIEPSSKTWWSQNNYNATTSWFGGDKSNCPSSDTSKWSSVYTQWSTYAPGSNAKPIWWPNCENVGTADSYLHNYFRLLVNIPPATTTENCDAISTSISLSASIYNSDKAYLTSVSNYASSTKAYSVSENQFEKSTSGYLASKSEYNFEQSTSALLASQTEYSRQQSTSALLASQTEYSREQSTSAYLSSQTEYLHEKSTSGYNAQVTASSISQAASEAAYEASTNAYSQSEGSFEASTKAYDLAQASKSSEAHDAAQTAITLSSQAHEASLSHYEADQKQTSLSEYGFDQSTSNYLSSSIAESALESSTNEYNKAQSTSAYLASVTNSKSAYDYSSSIAESALESSTNEYNKAQSTSAYLASVTNSKSAYDYSSSIAESAFERSTLGYNNAQSTLTSFSLSSSNAYSKSISESQANQVTGYAQAPVQTSSAAPDVSTQDYQTSQLIAIAATPTTTSAPTGGNTTAYIGGGAAGVAGVAAAAAAVFYFRKGATASAQVASTFSNNTNMNPLYEGMEQFDNPLYNGDAPVDDGFTNAAGNGPSA